MTMPYAALGQQGAVSQPAPGTVSQPAQQQQFVVPPTQVFTGEPSASYPAQLAHQLATPQAPAQQQAQQPVQQMAQGAYPAGWAPQGQPQGQPQPQLPVQGQQFQQAPQLQPGQLANPNLIVAPGMGFPPEWVGRPLGEVVRYYNTMKQGFNAAQQPQGQPQLPSQQPRPLMQGQPQQTQQGQPLTLESIQQVIRQETQQAVQQATMPQDIHRAAASITNNPYTRSPEVMNLVQQRLMSLPQQSWTDPAIWQGAVSLAIGDLAIQGRLPQIQQQVQQAPQQQGLPAQQMPAFQNGNPMPPQPSYNNLNAQQPWQPYGAPTGGFFTEQPNGGQPMQQAGQLPPAARAVAQKMGIPEQVFSQWANGSVPAAPNGSSM